MQQLVLGDDIFWSMSPLKYGLGAESSVGHCALLLWPWGVGLQPPSVPLPQCPSLWAGSTWPRCSSQPWWTWSSRRATIQPRCGTVLVRFFVHLGNKDPSCCLSLLACQLLVLHRRSVSAALWKRLYLQAAAQLCCLKGLTDPNCYDTCN